MNVRQNLFVVNPLVNEHKNKYIYGTDEIALSIFNIFFENGIIIDGFVSSDDVGINIWNKPVLRKEDMSSNSILFSINNEKIDGLKLNMALMPTIDLTKENVILFGAGTIGTKLLFILKKMGINIDAIIDNDINKTNRLILDVAVYSPEYLEECLENTVVVICGKYREEIENSLSNKNKFKIFYYNIDEKYLCVNNIVNIDMCYVQYLRQIIKKNNYLYGKKSACLDFQRALNLIGICVCTIFSDVNDENDFEIEDILYESNYSVFIVDEFCKELVEKLSDMGLEETCDFWSLIHLSNHYILTRKNVLDLNLGYSYVFDNNKGFKVYGQNDNRYRIVILGGSATDGDYSAQKGWVDFLYERLKKYNVTIYNGAVRGYSSTMEVIKFMRDVIPLKPQMVIAYDGVNDANYNTLNEYKNAFSFPYLSTLFANVFTDSHTIIKGVENDINGLETWHLNMRIMNYISSLFGIEFLSILQPMLASKKSYNNNEKSIIFAYKYINNEEYYNTQHEFRTFLNNVNDFKFYNFSNIFDDYNDIYMDNCHVYEDGNYIIAKKVFDIIEPLIN